MSKSFLSKMNSSVGTNISKLIEAKLYKNLSPILLMNYYAPLIYCSQKRFSLVGIDRLPYFHNQPQDGAQNDLHCQKHQLEHCTWEEGQQYLCDLGLKLKRLRWDIDNKRLHFKFDSLCTMIIRPTFKPSIDNFLISLICLILC